MKHYCNNIKQNACVLPLLIVILLIYSSDYATAGSSSYSKPKVVKTLPGFDGNLPFKLQTGYIGVGEEEEVQLFYYFFESERDPESDPLLIWLIGGPGCTTLASIFLASIGPISFNCTGIYKYFNYTTSAWEFHKPIPTLQIFPHSWTKIANIIFVDSPVGTGFSYGTTTKSYYTSDIATSQMIYEFLQKWFIVHPQFAPNHFYVCATSYSGMIGPLIAQEIVKGNEDEAGAYINLKGYILGSPFTDPYDADRIGRMEFIHRASVISDELYELSKVSCGAPYWNKSSEECEINMGYAAYSVKSLDVDNIFYEPNNPRTWCRSYINESTSIWANYASVRKALHVREGTVGNWTTRCNQLVKTFQTFNATISSSVSYHQYLTTKSIKALIFSGDQELTVPYLSTLGWIKKLNAKVSRNWRPWFFNDQVIGYVTEYSNGHYNLTFTTIKGAGHCPPIYYPRESSVMFERWLAGNPL